jgi:DNA-binding MarR family transcriptional regulator
MPISFNDAVRFGFLIHDVSRLRRVIGDRELKPLGVTRSQWWVLANLSRRDGMTQTALATDLDLTKVAIGGLLERMQAAGLILRRADPVDARIRRVFLTRAGTRLVGQIRDLIKKFEITVLQDSTEEEVAIAFQTLKKMKHRIMKMLDEDGGEAPGESLAAVDREEDFG